MRIIFALVFVGGVDSATVTSRDGTKDPTENIIAYRDKIRGGRQGCVDFEIVNNNEGRKYFQCPFLSDVVVHSNECLFFFRFSTWEQKWSYSINAELPVDVGDCLEVAKNENKDVKAVLVSLDANRIATVQCWLDKEALGEYTFMWRDGGVSGFFQGFTDGILYKTTSGEKPHEPYSVKWANKVCASFKDRWKATQDLLNKATEANSRVSLYIGNVMTNSIIAYRDKIRGGRQGCVDFEIVNNNEGRKYFHCPSASPDVEHVVVHSNDCLSQFRFSSGIWTSARNLMLPFEFGTCLNVAEEENEDVKAGLVSLEANRIATVKCSSVRNSDRQTSTKEVVGEYGEYRFNWDRIYHDKRNVKHSDKNQIVQTSGQGATETEEYSAVWANKLCASFALRWTETQRLLPYTV